MNAQRIGELNGPWAFALKAALVAFPVAITAVLGLGAWSVRTIYSHDARLHYIEETRFTASDADKLRSEAAKIPEWMRIKIESFEASQTRILDRIGDLKTDVEVLKQRVK